MGHWEKGHYVSVGGRGYWSKYGGGKLYKEPEEKVWYCQSCKEPQLAVMQSYKIPIGPDSEDSIRVCSVCKHIALRKNVVVYVELIKLIRPFNEISSAIANLLSLPIGY